MSHDKTEKPLYEALGKVVRARRLELQLSQEDLSQVAGVDRAFLSRVERGLKRPSFGFVASLARGLRMKYSRLVSQCERCQDADSFAGKAHLPTNEQSDLNDQEQD